MSLSHHLRSVLGPRAAAELEAALGSGGGGDFLPLDGSLPMTGPLDFGSDVEVRAPDGFGGLLVFDPDGNGVYFAGSADASSAYAWVGSASFQVAGAGPSNYAFVTQVFGDPLEYYFLVRAGGGLEWHGGDVSLAFNNDIDDPGLKLDGELFFGLDPAYATAGMEVGWWGLYAQTDAGNWVSFGPTQIGFGGPESVRLANTSAGYSPNLVFTRQLATSWSEILATSVQGGSSDFQLMNDGVMLWGAGGVGFVPLDVSLRRMDAGVLGIAEHGGGIRLTSPDGSHTKTIGIDNTGALVAA